VQHSRRQVYRRRRIVVSGTVVVVLAILVYLPLTLLAPLHAVGASQIPYTPTATTAPTITLPSYGASAISAVGYPQVLVQGGSTKPMPMASISKIVSTLVVLQKAPLAVGQAGPQIPFTAADEAIRKAYLARNGDVYPIKVGSSMSQLDVMKVTLVASANNYARALVDWAFGSEAKFLPVANAWLAQNGMKSTTLTDATGLNPANTSTPTDMITLGKLAIANPLVSQIIKIKNATLPVVGAISNTNSLLGKLGVDGIKTGTLDGAGSSLLFTTSEKIGGKTIRLIGVILDGPTHPIIDAEIRGLIKTVRSGFTIVKLTTTGEKFASYTTPWGTQAAATAASSRSVVIWAGTPIQSSIQTTKVAVTSKGTKVGAIVFSVAGESISVPLRLRSAIRDPGFWWRLTNPGILL
jgi:D-alanyl-D-alanine carboxypeptidase (penicillin-binding protein 5/6)